MLYSAHPSHVHSEFCVLILRGHDALPSLSWNDLEIANRLGNQVSLEVEVTSEVTSRIEMLSSIQAVTMDAARQ